MQVSHVNDHVTHAVIGGGQAVEFGISNSPEFFNILSSTLYKDQILAVVREVLCNAWDAHIEAGCTHIPVAITLDDEKFVIRDFGKGIHRDDMSLIYGTYGNSTKKNDGTQTGGFGLGCKSPFAYTDHFEVISCHEGVKTIYNLSKSNAQAMGKPGIIPIASFPASDSGLQVTIAIHNHDDRARFRTLIKRIASNGDMNMTLNGKKIEKLDFDTTKANYLVTREMLLDEPSRIMVRYGNVVYPVDSIPALAKEYRSITDHLDSLSRRPGMCYDRNNPVYHIVFQAPPHSIAVTPSRESLSMQEHTINTLRKLYQDFLGMIHKQFNDACYQHTIGSVNEAVKEARVSSLLDRRPVLPTKTDADKFFPEKICDLETMAQRYMSLRYPDTLEFRKKDITLRLGSMVTAGLLPRGLVQTFLHEMDGVTNYWAGGAYVQNSWLQRKVLAPLVKKLITVGLDPRNLYVLDSRDSNCEANGSLKTESPLVRVDQAKPSHLFNTLPYLRNIVVLSTSRYNIHDRAKQHEVLNKYGIYEGYLFYHVGMKKKDKQAALDFFNASGMHVVDLTFRQSWEVVPPSVKAARAPAKEGIVALSAIRTPDSIDTFRIHHASSPRLNEPEFIMNVSLRKDENNDRLMPWNELASRYIVDLFGSKGGITNNTSVASKWQRKGAKDSMEFIAEQLLAVLKDNPRLQEYWPYDADRALSRIGYMDTRMAKLVRIVYTKLAFRDAFGMVNNLTPEEKKYVYLLKQFVKLYNVDHQPAGIKKLMKKLNSIPVDPFNENLVFRFKDSPMIKMIDEIGLVILLTDKSVQPKHVDGAIQSLITVLNYH